MAFKGHGKEAVQVLNASDGKHFRLPRVVVTEAEPKEIADRSLYARGLFAIPVDAQYNPFQMVGFRAGNGKPQVRDQTGAVRVEHSQCFPGVDLAAVGIGSGRVCARRPMQSVGLLTSQVWLPSGALTQRCERYARSQVHEQNASAHRQLPQLR